MTNKKINITKIPRVPVTKIDTAHEEISKKLQEKKGIGKEEADEQAGKILSASKSKQNKKEDPETEIQNIKEGFYSFETDPISIDNTNNSSEYIKNKVEKRVPNFFKYFDMRIIPSKIPTYPPFVKIYAKDQEDRKLDRIVDILQGYFDIIVIPSKK